MSNSLSRWEPPDALQPVIAAFGELDDAFAQAAGTTTFDLAVGKPIPEIKAPALQKSTFNDVSSVLLGLR